MESGRRPRLTEPALRVLHLMVSDPGEAFYGLDLMDRCRLSSGTLYPLLRRLALAGWLLADNERIDPAVEGRPARTYYTLTALGEQEARSALGRLQTGPQFRWALT